jgi:hypothetical protein
LEENIWYFVEVTAMTIPEEVNLVVVEDLNIPLLVHALMAPYFEYLERVLYRLHGFTNDQKYAMIAPIPWLVYMERMKVSNRAALVSTLQMENCSESLAELYIEAVLGITKQETKNSAYTPLGDLHAPLGDLKASIIKRGPFRISVTDKPSEHFTFAPVDNKLTLRMLDLDIIFRLHMLQASGIAR